MDKAARLALMAENEHRSEITRADLAERRYVRERDGVFFDESNTDNISIKPPCIVQRQFAEPIPQQPTLSREDVLELIAKYLDIVGDESAAILAETIAPLHEKIGALTADVKIMEGIIKQRSALWLAGLREQRK